MRSGNNFANNDRRAGRGTIIESGGLRHFIFVAGCGPVRDELRCCTEKSFHKIDTCSGLLSLHRSTQYKKARVKTHQYWGEGVQAMGWCMCRVRNSAVTKVNSSKVIVDFLSLPTQMVVGATIDSFQILSSSSFSNIDAM